MNRTELDEKIWNSPLSESVLNWYSFRKSAALLEVTGHKGSPGHSLGRLFERRCSRVDTVSLEQGDLQGILQGNLSGIARHAYEYVVCLEGLEYTDDPSAFVRQLLTFLKPGGTLLLGADNRFGIRSFCGFSEKHTGVPFFGVNDYFKGLEKGIPEEWRESGGSCRGRSYSKREMDEILRSAGAEHSKYYYPVPDLRMPQMICTDAEIPYGEIKERLNDYDYADPSMLALEHRMFDEIAYAGAMPFLANSFLIEISLSGEFMDAEFVMVTTDRGPRRAAATIFRSDEKVIRRPLDPEGEESIREIDRNTKALSEKGIPVVPTELVQDENGLYLEMPRIRAERLSAALDRLAAEDRERFAAIFDEIYGCIRKSFEEKENGRGRVYPDLAPCNAFLTREGRLLFFDQEFTKEESDCLFAMYRTLKYFFASAVNARQEIDFSSILARYGITEDMAAGFEEEEKEFIEGIRNRSGYEWLYTASSPDLARICANIKKNVPAPGKPYKIGYVPGVFDLFHTGHLVLIERCKERCEHLIVGVLTDELVEYYKGKKPVIPLKDRMRVIGGLRAVDEVIEVNFGNTDKIDAWEQLHYDCHFSGNDHVGHWTSIEEELRKRGAAMEFFPYTQGISTTMIKDVMKSKKD